MTVETATMQSLVDVDVCGCTLIATYLLGNVPEPDIYLSVQLISCHTYRIEPGEVSGTWFP